MNGDPEPRMRSAALAYIRARLQRDGADLSPSANGYPHWSEGVAHDIQRAGSQ
jgi:hypothetical protein